MHSYPFSKSSMAMTTIRITNSAIATITTTNTVHTTIIYILLEGSKIVNPSEPKKRTCPKYWALVGDACYRMIRVRTIEYKLEPLIRKDGSFAKLFFREPI